MSPSLHKLAFIYLAWWPFTQWVLGCGMLVHTEITYRSLELFEPTTAVQKSYVSMLERSPGYVQAGSFFPDWGYQCLGYSQQAEDAHWAPFIRAAVEYIQETYLASGRRDDPHVEGLISFIFAVMSHDVADVRWHSLQGLSGYFIDAMAQMDFHGVYADAHNVADTGAEFTLQHLTPRLASYINATTWHVPVRDLVNIYSKLYAGAASMPRVPVEGHLTYCMTTAFAASRMDLAFGERLFDVYGRTSPFLVEDIMDYYKGGLQDMAASVADCHASLIDAFNGIEPAVLCGSYFDNSDRIARSSREHRDHRMYASVDQHVPGLQHHYDQAHGVLTLSIQQQQQHRVDATETKKDKVPVTVSMTSTAGTETMRLSSQPAITHSSRRPYRMIYQEETSSSVTLDQAANRVDRMWELPWRRDDVCVDLGTADTNARRGDHALLTLSAPVSSASIGHATTAGDFDGDGELDLAISAPYLNNDKIATGAVYLLNGTRALLNSQHGHRDGGDIRQAAQLMLKGSHDRGRFGWSMATVDLNADGVDDLVIAAPFAKNNRGHVDIFYGRPKHGISSTRPDLRVMLPGTEGLGVSLRGLDIDGDGHADLVVGCPYCTVAGAPHAGAVYVFLSSGRKAPAPDMVFQSPHPQSYEHFGTAFESIDSVLLVGAPGYSAGPLQRVGRVYAIQPSTGSHRWTMAGSQPFQQFGSLIVSSKTSGAQGHLVAIASPSEETTERDIIIQQRHWQAGVVRVYDWQQLNTGNTEHDLTFGLLRLMQGRQAAGHLGASMAFFKSHDGQDIGLWVGEPMANGERGRVHRWSFTEDDVVCMKNADSVSRFGSHLQSAAGVLSITSAHYSRDARLAGAIHLILQ